MDESGASVDGTSPQNDRDSMLNDVPDAGDDLSLFFDFDLSNGLSDPFPDSIDDLEQLLMVDDGKDGDVSTEQIPDDFFSDLLLDSPVGSNQSEKFVGVAENAKSSDSNSSASSEELEKADDFAAAEEENKGRDGDDPISKKKLRQLRNRDAAVRSRERKKMYVKDLEMKSRYLEGECRRLGMLLQYCAAENQALHLSLQNAKAFGASMAKQESAVLILESLLLGSLLWFMGIICLFILPKPPLPPLENVVDKIQGSLVIRKKSQGDEASSTRMYQLFAMSRRCKASRWRIKCKPSQSRTFCVIVTALHYGASYISPCSVSA